MDDAIMRTRAELIEMIDRAHAVWKDRILHDAANEDRRIKKLNSDLYQLEDYISRETYLQPTPVVQDLD
jgi:hypothetical protein